MLLMKTVISKMETRLVKCTVDARMINHSGIGTYIRMLMPYLCTKFDVTLLGNPEQLSKFAHSARIVPFLAPIYSIKEQIDFRKLIRPCDIFWSPHYNVPLFKVKAGKRVVTVHDVFHLAFYNELSFKQKLYARLVINKAMKASNEIITVSDFSKNEIVKFANCKAEKINVIHNGVRQNRILKPFEGLVEKYKLPSNYILYVGNVKPHKNLNNLLKAYLKLPVEIQNKYKIIVAGKIDGFITGDDRLMNWINQDPVLKEHVVFTGFVEDDDMDTVYANATLFILPSLYEGFGLPPLEAMLNECPVIVSDIGSLSEVCGEAAVYCNQHDPQDISNKLKDLLLNKTEREKLIKNGLARIKLFSWDEAADKHISLFNKLIR